jgi:SAM-dependent methyltransferase
MKNFKVIDFRFTDVSDIYDLKFAKNNAWSRIYEYTYVLNFIKENTLKNEIKPKIHNSSWGFEGVHIIFRDELDLIGDCVHSDIIHSIERPTFYYDITTENKEFENSFDFVLNVSVIEHLSDETKRIQSIENLFKQVKNGGYFILTFDYPRVNMKEIEKIVGVECKSAINTLNGKNSIYPNKNYENLNIIYLILKKDE